MSDQPSEDHLRHIRDAAPTGEQAAAHLSAVVKPLGFPVPEVIPPISGGAAFIGPTLEIVWEEWKFWRPE